MSVIVQMLSELCPDGVTFMTLGDVCTVKTGPNINKQIIADNPGQYPVINSGRDPLGYFNDFNTENDPIGIASRGSVGLVTWTPGRYFRGNLNYSCTPIKPAQLDARFLYHYLLHVDSDIQKLATHQGIPALNASALKTLNIPIPPRGIQREIVHVLDAFTELTAELTAELAARKKQYDHYRNRLLRFEEGGLEWRALEEVVIIKTGQAVNKQMISDNSGDYPVINSGKEPLGFIDKWNTDEDPIGVTSRGAGVGSVTWTKGKYFRGNLNYSVTIRDKNVLRVRYLYHILQEMQPEIQARCTYDGIPALNAGKLKGLRIPIVRLLEQDRIIDALDKFDDLTNSITEGLPREIELRQKQYGYYRDLLLSFSEPEAAEA